MGMARGYFQGLGAPGLVALWCLCAAGGVQAAAGDLPPAPPANTPLVPLPPFPGETQTTGTEAEPNPPPLYGQKKGDFGAVSDPAFQSLLKKTFPLSPDQVKTLREYFEMAQRASSAPNQVPAPLVSTKSVALSPGAVPPVVRLATGYVSSVVFLDETGAPWPIQAYDLGDPKSFNIQWDQSSHVLMIQGVGPYSTGNMAVRLKGLDIPVMLTIVSDQKHVDYRLDFRVQGRGPGALASFVSEHIPGQAPATLIHLLEGIPPQGAKRLHTSEPEIQAWIHGGQLYVRTALPILSPHWQATLSSADGMHAYEMTPTPLLLLSRAGQAISCKVEGL